MMSVNQKNYQKNTAQNENAPVSFCPLPWASINIKADGVYRLCDHSASSRNKGVLRDQSGRAFSVSDKADWNEVVNSSGLRAVRRSMLAGKRPPECARCRKELDSGMRGHNFFQRDELAKIIQPEVYPGHLRAKALTQKDGSVSLKDFPVSFLNIRFGNLCNLRCAMCGPEDSSAWQKEYNNIFSRKAKERGAARSSAASNHIDDSHLWRQIEKHGPGLRKVYIVGGEPLLMKSYYKFLNWCVESGASRRLTLEFNTNITRVPDTAHKLWKHFKRLVIGISLDGYGKINDFIRYPSQWRRLEKNMSLLDQAEGENLDLYIITSVSVLNIQHLPEFIMYLMRQNHRLIGRFQSPVINPHPVHKPHFLNINILEEAFKEKIQERFEKYKTHISNYDWRRALGPSRTVSWEKKINRACCILDNYIRFMQQTSYSPEEKNKWRRGFIYYMDRLDALRKTNWPKTFPDLYQSSLKWRSIESNDTHQV